MREAAALLAVLALAGCGGAQARGAASTSRGRTGPGADQVWLVRPAGPPRSVVVFLHGLGGADRGHARESRALAASISRSGAAP